MGKARAKDLFNRQPCQGILCLYLLVVTSQNTKDCAKKKPGNLDKKSFEKNELFVACPVLLYKL